MSKKAMSRQVAARIKGEARKRQLACYRGFQPNPCELDAVFYDPAVAEAHRAWKCPMYAACLNVATIANWINFTCGSCQVWARYYNRWTKRVRKVIA